MDKKTYYMRRVLNLGKGKCYLLLLSKGMSYVLTKKNAANSSRYRCLEFQLLRIEIWTRLPGSVSCMVSSSEVYVDLHCLLLLAQEQTFRRCQHCFEDGHQALERRQHDSGGRRPSFEPGVIDQ